jgi:hypothetical protein
MIEVEAASFHTPLDMPSAERGLALRLGEPFETYREFDLCVPRR